MNSHCVRTYIQPYVKSTTRVEASVAERRQTMTSEQNCTLLGKTYYLFWIPLKNVLLYCRRDKKVVIFLVVMVIVFWHNTDVYIDDFYPYFKVEQIDKRYAFVNSTYLITVYEPSPNWGLHKDFPYYDVGNCPYTNCEIRYDERLIEASDVVIFYDRTVPSKIPFNRPLGQVWVFYIDETPVYQFYSLKKWRRKRWLGAFNWTAIYDPTTSDIFFPYGEIRINPNPPVRNFHEIARRKTKDAVWIVSNCKALSEREEYINRLKKYINIDVFGKCGEALRCDSNGDHCLDFLNKTYKYYLAFENSLCPYYYTEKIFQNYNNDVVLVARGGSHDEVSKIIPDETIISAAKFSSADELGKYLKDLPLEEYAKILERKNEYQSTGFKAVFQKAMCNVCERINHPDKYRKTIPDLNKLSYFDSCS